MDLILLIVILLAGFLIKYLIDTIQSMSNEIKEIKMKCVMGDKNIILTEKNTNPISKLNSDLIDNVKYIKNYFQE
jgi:hypothetical protein